MDKLRIGIFPSAPYAPHIGGGFSYCDALAQAIDDYAFHPSLDFRFLQIEFLPAAWGEKNKVLRLQPWKTVPKGIRVGKQLANRVFQPLSRYLFPLKTVSRRYNRIFNRAWTEALERQIEEHEIDFLYYLRPDNNVLKHPFVATHWDIGHRSTYSFPEVILNGEFQQRERYLDTTLLRAFAVCCESEAGKAELIRYANVNPDRVFVVPLFPGHVATLKPDAAQRDACLRKYGLQPRQYFYYPAQFWPHKNHYNLLLAFRKVLDVSPAFRIVFTGADMGNQEYIRQVVKELRLQEHTVLPGFVEPGEVASLYSGATAMVMPTFLGPTNMPLLEAQALGCPVICSNLQGHREMMGSGARYVNPESAESIAEAMLAEIEGPSPASPPNQIFTLQNAVQQIETMFLKLMPLRKSFGHRF